MIEFYHLPPLLGSHDIEAEIELTRRRMAALAWMRQNKVSYIGNPVPDTIAPIPAPRVHYLHRKSTEGK